MLSLNNRELEFNIKDLKLLALVDGQIQLIKYGQQLFKMKT